MNTFSRILNTVDAFVWGPYMLVLLVGTGIVLCIRTRFLPWRRLPRALKSTFGRSSRAAASGSTSGGISPFAALMTSLAATIGTGNMIGVSTALVLGGPGALVWMWIAAAFGIASKFSECMLAVKYRETNLRGETVGGPMYTLKNAFPNRRAGAVLGFLFALFAVISSFGIGNMTQANSIADALSSTFSISTRMTGMVLTILTLLIIVGGIRSISKIASVLVPSMAFLYIAAGMIVLAVHYRNIPQSLMQIVTMAFSTKAATGGILGTITASGLRAMRYGVARGVFSNEAGMGSAAITAASAAGSPVRQGYLNMTAPFLDTIIICSVTGLCIMCSGVLGTMQTMDSGTYAHHSGQLVFLNSTSPELPAVYEIAGRDASSLTLLFDQESSAPDAASFFQTDAAVTLTRIPDTEAENLSHRLLDGNAESMPDRLPDGNMENIPARLPDGNTESMPDRLPDSNPESMPARLPDGNTESMPDRLPDDSAEIRSPGHGESLAPAEQNSLTGAWRSPHGYVFLFRADGTYKYAKPLTGAALTIAAFRSGLGSTGAYLLTVSIVLFAFSTILGWEYLGERSFEFLMRTHKYNLFYRFVFSCAVFLGANAALDIVWNFSNIANALMSIPNLLCLLALSGEVAADIRQYEKDFR